MFTIKSLNSPDHYLVRENEKASKLILPDSGKFAYSVHLYFQYRGAELYIFNDGDNVGIQTNDGYVSIGQRSNTVSFWFNMNDMSYEGVNSNYFDKKFTDNQAEKIDQELLIIVAEYITNHSDIINYNKKVSIHNNLNTKQNKLNELMTEVKDQQKEIAKLKRQMKKL